RDWTARSPARQPRTQQHLNLQLAGIHDVSWRFPRYVEPPAPGDTEPTASAANDRRQNPTGQSCGWVNKSGTEGTDAGSRHTPRAIANSSGRDMFATCAPAFVMAIQLAARARRTTLSNRTDRRGESQASTTISEPLCSNE